MAAPNLSPEKNFGKYRIIEELGAGGMGIVYRAYDTQLQRDVAIKVLNARTLGDTKARQRFRSEALILSRLNHPNVECVYDSGSEGDVDFLVLEYVTGTTLDEVIRNGRLSEPDVIGLGIQLARGLAAAHAQRVLHRDLKPGNLRVTPENVLKILDFGLAQLMPLPEDSTLDTDAIARQNPLAGTPAYLSPEQLRGVDPDARSDIYSAGVVLYELATGIKPFPQTGQLLLDTILNGVPPAPRSHNKEISLALQAIILRCLEKDPKLRYQSARELQIDLERLSTEHHPSGPSLASPQRPVPGANRHKFLIAALVLVAAAVAAFFGWGWIIDPGPHKQRVMAVLPMDTAGQDPATSALGLGLTETVAAKLAEASDTSAIQVVSPQDLRDQKVKTAADAQRIFGADYVLESSMQRSGDTIRINCSLVDPKNHRQIAAKTIDANTTDPFGLQDRVVTVALDITAVKLKPEDRKKLNVVQNTQPAAYEAYIRGRGYLQEYEKPENIENAILEFSQAVKVDPSYALGYAGLGDAYWKQFEWLFKGSGAVALASQNCEAALSLDPQLVEGHICLGTILNGTGKYDRAIVEFKKALDTNSQSDEALGGLAKAYEKVGDFTSAEAAYKRAVDMRPTYWGAYHALGLFYYRRAQYADAAATFKKETERAPDNNLSYITLGGAYITLGKYEDALASFQRSIDLRPSFQAYSNLAYTYYVMHLYSDAIIAEEEAVKLNADDWEIWGNLADELYWSPNRRKEAPDKYRRAIELSESQLQINPKDGRVRVYLSNYLAMVGEKAAALEHLQLALAQAPSEDVLIRAAVTYNQLGNTTKALDYLEKAANAGYSRPVIRDSPEFGNLQRNGRFMALVGNAT